MMLLCISFLAKIQRKIIIISSLLLTRVRESADYLQYKMFLKLCWVLACICKDASSYILLILLTPLLSHSCLLFPIVCIFFFFWWYLSLPPPFLYTWLAYVMMPLWRNRIFLLLLREPPFFCTNITLFNRYV